MIRPLRAYAPPFFLRPALEKKVLSRGVEAMGEIVGFSNPSSVARVFASGSNKVVFHIRYQSPFAGEGQMFGIQEMDKEDPRVQRLLSAGTLPLIKYLWDAPNTVFEDCVEVRVKVLPGALVAIVNR